MSTFFITYFNQWQAIQLQVLAIGIKKEESKKVDLDWEIQVVAAAQEDSRHFEKIYEAYFEKIFLYIHRRVKDEALADDLTSQTFLKALLNIHKFRFKGYSIASWLYKIATNEFNMHFRNHKNAVRNVCLHSSGLYELLEYKEDDENNNPDLEKVVAMLQNLAMADLQLLEWRFTEDRSFKEIAFLMSISEDNAKRKTYRLLDKIRKTFFGK